MDSNIIGMDDKQLINILLDKLGLTREQIEKQFNKDQKKRKLIKPKKQPKKQPKKEKEEPKQKVKNQYTNRKITIDGQTYKKIMKQHPELFLMDDKLIDLKEGEKIQNKLNEELKKVHEMDDKIIGKKVYSCLTHLFTKVNKDEAEKLKHTHYIIGKDGNYYIHFNRATYNVKNRDVNEFNKIQVFNFEKKEFGKLVKILREDNSFDELYKYRGEYINMILIESIMTTEGVINENYNPVDEDLMMGESENTIYNQYIKYGLNSNAETFGDLFEIKHDKYILDNYKQNSCYVNLIIDTYRQTFVQDAKKINFII